MIQDKEIVKKDILNIYVEFLKDTEQEVKSIAILKLPEICEKLTEKTIIETIAPLLKGLATDPSPHVRQSIGQILVKVARFLNSENLIEHIIPIIQINYKDEALDVRLSVIGTFGIFHQMMGSANIKTYIIPLILEANAEKNWRSRLAIVEYLPKLCKEVGFELFKEQLQDFMNTFLFDHFSAIREQAIANLLNLNETFGYDKIKDMVISGLSSLSKNANYLFRITALHALIKLKDIMSLQDLNNLYNEFTAKMINDKVPNVRFNLIKTYVSLKDKWKESEKKQNLKFLEVLKKDADKDVKYMMTQTI